MLYIVKVYEGDEIHVYEYGLLEHAREHMRWETLHTELYVWLEGREEFMEAIN